MIPDPITGEPVQHLIQTVTDPLTGKSTQKITNLSTNTTSGMTSYHVTGHKPFTQRAKVQNVTYFNVSIFHLYYQYLWS